ncbi:unnamed protein product [Allacma fusca]|uniref:Uncharacterized protein n=1 Tax=Allacma fusca TaxID=39272 RepID=A0A8J2PRN1_9HEXA|nr:unnamed protein product [Allacma fusca]
MWLPLTENNIGIVVYPFNGTGIVPAPYGLELSLGETIVILGENSGWFVGRRKISDKICVVPVSYVHRTSLNESTTEVTTVVREWGEIWKKLYKNGHDYQQGVIGDSIRELIEGRRLLSNGNLTKEQNEEWRLKLANKIDWGNRKLGLDLVPRDGYKVITGGEDIGVVKLYRFHVKSVETAEAARTTLRKKRSTLQEPSGGHHLFMTVRDFNYNIGEDCEIFFQIYDAIKSAFISERYATALPSSNSVFIDKIQTIATLFKDLCAADFCSELYIVTHILRVGRMFYNDNTTKKSTQSYRRPFACGVLNLCGLVSNQYSSNSQENEHNFKLYGCDEKDFWQIPDLIIKDVIMPGVVRNDLYVTIVQGEFEKSGKTMGGKNISVSVHVLDSNGNHIENGIFSAVNLPNYESFILYHNNNPKWNEIIKIKVPIEKFPDAHLRIEYRHCSTKEKNDKKLFGFSYIKLMDAEGVIIKDTTHVLPIYKCDDNSKLLPSNYFSTGTFPKSTKESIYINTHLVSTKLTQNMDLVSLLKWKSHPDKVKQTLVDIAKLSGEEIVKFLQDVLDVLFAMFVSEDGNSTEYSGEAFIVLLNIFTLLEDSKFEHFKPVIDAYIHDHFAAALVYKGLLSSVTHYATTVPILEKDRIKEIRKCFRTLDYIFKFAVQSQILFARATGGNMEDSFRRDVSLMFDAFNDLVSFESNAEEMVSTQSALLLNLKKIYNNLARVYPVVSLSHFILEVFNNIPLHQSAHPLSPSKLSALIHLVDSDIFKHKNCRVILLPEICKHIRHHLSIRDELKLTSDLLLSILDLLHHDPLKSHNDIEIIASNVMEPLINAVLILERTSSIITPLLEDFRDDKVKWVLSEYQDMRVRMCKEILNMWSCVEERVHFIPSLIGKILLVSLSPLKELASLVLPLVIDLIDAQFHYYGDFHVVESELIDKLDTYIMDSKGNESYIQTFNNVLTDKLNLLSPSWSAAGHQLIGSIKSLLEILIDYRNIPNDAENKGKKMNCINNLLTFYKNVNLQQMYVKYVYKLNDLHVNAENYVEAGFTLLLHGDMIDFKHEYEVKEQIHLQVIKYFDQGKLWECAIPLCKELASIYEKKFDYTKLSNILVTSSTHFNNILTQLRPEPEYFRVSFIGLGYPLFVRNKEFIYRGYDYERLTSFVQRIVSEWPTAEVLKNYTNDSNLMNAEGQYLLIRTVKPLPSYPESYELAPSRIKSFYNWNNISKFQYDHSLTKNMDDVSSIYIERTVLETASPFPGILRCFLVKSKVTTVLTPIKFAVEKMIEINKNLEDTLATFSDANSGAINANPLSMRLQGILDANVQGGLPKYQEAFFIPEFLTNNPDCVEDVNNLNRQIINQIEILDRALTLHGTIIPPGIQPLHNRLVECFNAMRANFEGLTIPPILKRSDSLRILNSNSVNNRISSGYGYINPIQSEDEDFYSLPSDQPPPIPNRKKKHAVLTDQQLLEKPIIEKMPPSTPPPPPPTCPEKTTRDSKPVVIEQQSEYIIMPPSRLRELSGTPTPTTPPRPPKFDDIQNGTKTPPPVPPKPTSNRDSTGTSASGTNGDRRSTNSNSSGGGTSSYKEYYVLPSATNSLGEGICKPLFFKATSFAVYFRVRLSLGKATFWEGFFGN